MADNFDNCSHFGRKFNETSALNPVWTQNENKLCYHASESAIKHHPTVPLQQRLKKVEKKKLNECASPVLNSVTNVEG
jgi:hypothetical protein